MLTSRWNERNIYIVRDQRTFGPTVDQTLGWIRVLMLCEVIVWLPCWFRTVLPWGYREAGIGASKLWKVAALSIPTVRNSERVCQLSLAHCGCSARACDDVISWRDMATIWLREAQCRKTCKGRGLPAVSWCGASPWLTQFVSACHDCKDLRAQVTCYLIGLSIAIESCGER